MSVNINDRILLRVGAESANAAFGLDESVDTGKALWAKVEPVHSLVIRAGMQTGEVPTHLVFIRYSVGTKPEDITAEHVIDYQGRRYRCMDAIDFEGKRRFTRISVKDLGPI